MHVLFIAARVHIIYYKYKIESRAREITPADTRMINDKNMKMDFVNRTKRSSNRAQSDARGKING